VIKISWLACSQNAGLITEIVPARELIERMAAEAETIFKERT
jgi:hypothetical protein